MKLKKELSLVTLTLYGIGIILGAGIYVLIGQGAGLAGNALWISFTLGALIALFTGFSYAELTGMFPRDAAEYVFVKNAFRKRHLAFIVEWIMVFTLIVSASTVALGFGSYLSYVFGVHPAIAAAGLIVSLSILNYIGIKESARYNMIATLIEVSGLVIVIAVGMMFIGRTDIDYFESPAGLQGILSATALIFFAFIGFEDIVNLSEETKNARKVVPRALVLSLSISTIFYILVSSSSIAVLGAEGLSKSQAPLTEVVSTAVPQAKLLMSVIALFATSNTVLAILIVVSRMFYGLSCNHALPKAFCKISRRGTPHISIFTVMFLSVGTLLLGGIKTIALLTDIGIFIVYIFINLSVIWLRFKKPKAKRTFKSPLNIGRFPLLALLGILSSGLMLLHFEPMIILYEIAIVIFGFLIYGLLRRR